MVLTSKSMTKKREKKQTKQNIVGTVLITPLQEADAAPACYCPEDADAEHSAGEDPGLS